MPYILLAIGAGIGVYALYRFLRTASREQGQKLLLSLGIGLIVVLVFAMLLTGRYPLAAVLAVLLIPLAARLYRLLTPRD